MKYIVAVSGGVDSVVLLDRLVREGMHQLTVAHFDHGVRPDSAADARFVSELANRYRLPFIAAREELGPRASEELARRRRYLFLRRAAREHQATIVTAHHADDVVETIAINLSRGTGWRGLAVLDAQDIERPLLAVPKQALRQYALDNRLEWVEDSTNDSSVYLRNRLRRLVYSSVSRDTSRQISTLHVRQVALKAAIAEQTNLYLCKDNLYARHLLTHCDTASAAELLRAFVVAAGAPSPIRPQLQRGLLAIKTARPGTYCQLGSGVKIAFTARTFTIQTI